jgi:signal peptidase I
LAQFRKSAVREYAESIGLAVLFALMLRAFVVEAFQIPSQSMEPTLLVGDHLFVNKFVYGLRIPFTKYDLIRFGEPERGDVVVFIFPVEEVSTEAEMQSIMNSLGGYRIHSDAFGYPESLAEIDQDDSVDDWGHPFRYERLSPAEYRLASAGPDGVFDTGDDITNANTALPAGHTSCITPENTTEAKDYIKRVIGVGGDRIRVEDNIVYINDEPVEHEALPEQRDAFNRPMVRAVERLGDAEYVVQYYGAVDDFEEITVRDGYIFVMGDNRDNSSDSRCWGQVPVENVKGEALFIFWSGGSEHGFLGNRWNRMLNGVE